MEGRSPRDGGKCAKHQVNRNRGKAAVDRQPVTYVEILDYKAVLQKYQCDVF